MNDNTWRCQFGDVEIIEHREPVLALHELLTEQGVENYVHRRADAHSPWTLVANG
jgi:hypothetical protein